MIRTFDLDEAQRLLPEVQRVTAEAAHEVEPILAEAKGLGAEDRRRKELEERGQRIVNSWAEQIRALGAEPKGLWLVDFDSGEGYYCWRYPEPSIEYFHTYEGGFSARTLIAPRVLH